MEIDYIFPRGIFSFEKSARAKILSEWKTAVILSMENVHSVKIFARADFLKLEIPRGKI